MDKAISYCLRRWHASSRLLDDGRLCISNNAAECQLPAVAVGRTNRPLAGPVKAVGVCGQS
ncbi:transposase [Bradyrhizobium sp. 139]|nr:transposase [Bradyrhizobium sp. 139]